LLPADRLRAGDINAHAGGHQLAAKY
jgi:hypothetical protein